MSHETRQTCYGLDPELDLRQRPKAHIRGSIVPRRVKGLPFLLNRAVAGLTPMDLRRPPFFIIESAKIFPMRCFTERFWQMCAGFIVTVFIAVVLMFIINQFGGEDEPSGVSPDKMVAGEKR